MKVNIESIFNTSQLFVSGKSKLAKTSNPNTELVVRLIVQHEEYQIKALADTGAISSSSILKLYTSAPCIKPDDNKTNNWSIMGRKFTTTKSGI
jgi:hypothetical protein